MVSFSEMIFPSLPFISKNKSINVMTVSYEGARCIRLYASRSWCVGTSWFCIKIKIIPLFAFVVQQHTWMLVLVLIRAQLSCFLKLLTQCRAWDEQKQVVAKSKIAINKTESTSWYCKVIWLFWAAKLIFNRRKLLLSCCNRLMLLIPAVIKQVLWKLLM